MDKSSTIVGSMLGAVIVLIVFSFIINPPADITKPEIIVTNGHSVSTVGEVTLLPSKKDLTLIEIFERSEPGVVQVNVQRPQQIIGSSSVGSGFVFDINGYIITNAHVVRDAEKIIVTFLDGRSYNADLIGSDPSTDIAVIQVKADVSLLHPLPLGDSSKLKVGEQISAIGNPYGLSGSMTSGIVSQLGRQLPSENRFLIPDVIQTDAAINPGNSGGPLINSRGEVVGINSAIQSTTGEFTGIGFAVPSNTITKIVPGLIRDGEYNHPWIGIAGEDIEPDLAIILGLQNAVGFLIITVVEDSPAEKAGLHGSSETVEENNRLYKIGGDIMRAISALKIELITKIIKIANSAGIMYLLTASIPCPTPRATTKTPAAMNRPWNSSSRHGDASNRLKVFSDSSALICANEFIAARMT